MKTAVADNRVIFVVESSNPREVGEARFKLSAMSFGYGKSDKFHYWSLPGEESMRGFEILTAIFGQVRRL